jgi:hypothetical protein
MNPRSSPDLQRALDALPDAVAGMNRLARAIDPVRGVICLSSAEVQRRPELLWNAFVCLLSECAYEDLRPSQRPAHLAFWYDAEVQSGGHAQYITNPSGLRADETVQALRAIGADEHASLLARCLATCTQASGELAADSDASLHELDAQFHSLKPSLVDILERHFEAHRPDFVTVADGS